MSRILIVDYSNVDRQLAGALLARNSEWTIDYAANGNEALEKMERSAVDIVVTDLLMPGMNGLELVVAVRAKYPHVPVVLMTSHGSEEIAAQALDEGAASYVPKRLLPRRLLETVDRLLRVSRKRYGRSPLLDHMIEVSYCFVLANDTDLADLLVSHVQEQATQMGLCDETDCMRIGVALHEALTNAIYHGNLEMGSELREGRQDDFHTLIASRSAEAPYRDRGVHVAARLTRKEAVLVIRDEGRGFDPSTLPDPLDPANLEKASGRGIFLMRSFMDEVRFDDGGRSVTMVKRGPRAGGNLERGEITG